MSETNEPSPDALKVVEGIRLAKKEWRSLPFADRRAILEALMEGCFDSPPGGDET